jgi:hypothetical protein
MQTEETEYQNLLKGFTPIVASMKQIAEEAVKIYAPQVEAIIKTQSTDNQRIEKLLDGMLDFCFADKMLWHFKKLCRYYYTINPQATAEYILTYKDLWENE